MGSVGFIRAIGKRRKDQSLILCDHWNEPTIQSERELFADVSSLLMLLVLTCGVFPTRRRPDLRAEEWLFV